MDTKNSPFSTEIELDQSWIEPLYDHVHHGRCLSLLEQARLAFLVEIGFPNDVLLKKGEALVITRVEAVYKREIKKGRVRVTCEEPSVEGRYLTLRQRVFNDRGKLMVEATVESVFMNVRTRRGMDVPQDFRQAFERTLGRNVPKASSIVR